VVDQAKEGLLSPFLQTQRIAAARPFLRGSVLDVGCGSGDLAAYVPPWCYLEVHKNDTSIVFLPNKNRSSLRRGA